MIKKSLALAKNLIKDGFPDSSIKINKLDFKDTQIIDFEDSQKLLDNKKACLKVNYSKYVQIHADTPALADILNAGSEFLGLHGDVRHLDHDLPGYRFDRTVREIPEDVVICSVLPDGANQVTAIHLCAPNGWSAQNAIGKSFAEIHKDVRSRSGKLIVPPTDSFVKAMTRLEGTWERIGAISIRCNELIDRHPETYVGEDWENNQLFLRFERQTITALPEVNSFIFTIRTYFADLLSKEMLPLSVNAFDDFNLKSYINYLIEDDYKWNHIKRKLKAKTY